LPAEGLNALFAAHGNRGRAAADECLGECECWFSRCRGRVVFPLNAG
jgi:hypothetical protein